MSLLTKALNTRLEKPFGYGSRTPFILLHFKCINREEDIWAVQITQRYRAIGEVSNL